LPLCRWSWQYLLCLLICLQGGLEFSEGASAKWIFDVEIENLRADFFKDAEKTLIMLDPEENFLIDLLRSTF
jgi:hypothetical protein